MLTSPKNFKIFKNCKYNFFLKLWLCFFSQKWVKTGRFGSYGDGLVVNMGCWLINTEGADGRCPQREIRLLLWLLLKTMNRGLKRYMIATLKNVNIFQVNQC